MNQINKLKLWKTIVVTTLLSVPALSSIISAIHLVKLFNLGNELYLSYTLAIVFELGAIASFLALKFIPSTINKWMVWFIFIMLAFLQIIGNVFYSYDFIYIIMQTQSTWLNSFNDFMGYFTGNDAKTNHMILSWIIGLPIPLIALFLLKITPEFWEQKDEVKIKINTSSNNDKLFSFINNDNIEKIEEYKNHNKSINKESDNINTPEIKKENDLEYINKEIDKNDYVDAVPVNMNPAIFQNNKPNG